MKLEHQVVSLELSQKLKELGFEQESLFYWQQGNLFLPDDKEIQNDWKVGIFGAFNDKEFISAYTVAELGEMLPEILPVKGRATDYDTDYSLSISKLENRCTWEICYCGGGDCGCYGNKIIEEKTEADARAKMLIYLKENKLI